MSNKPIQSHAVGATLSNATRPSFKPHALNKAMTSAFKMSAGGIAQIIGMQNLSNPAAFDEDLQLIENRVHALLNPPSPASRTYSAFDKPLAKAALVRFSPGSCSAHNNRAVGPRVPVVRP